MEDPRVEFLESIAFDRLRVELTSSPIVLLCGGKVPVKESPSDPDPQVRSVRHALTNRHTSYECFRPEEITDWQTDGIFHNLMEFEEELSAICSLIVIVLESEGAIAELGAFSQVEDVSNRLMVVVSNRAMEENSFINLGILRHVTKNRAGSVASYPWVIEKDRSQAFCLEESVLNDIELDIEKRLSKLSKSPTFKPQSEAHKVVVIFHLIEIFNALKLSEISEYLAYFNISIVLDSLRRKLFLLEKFKLVKREEYSDSTFYVVTGDFHKVRFSPVEGRKIDLLRISVDCMKYYEANRDRHRLGALKSVRKGG
ncbi:hypothetical protein EDC38_0457 [Marinimicrobium koreense]|uniref:Uncharacterized protein n=1 Tax=Marinimicrobium koreense TaxID=306545 RepID=A0A3N1P4V9_9GAMM|nr:retron St85 family effector protein [Marinimicrobium koreense]ROQ19866.1 hypothetical protein EDC38_0457 [Marinimicrobium koreense]